MRNLTIAIGLLALNLHASPPDINSMVSYYPMAADLIDHAGTANIDAINPLAQYYPPQDTNRFGVFPGSRDLGLNATVGTDGLNGYALGSSGFTYSMWLLIPMDQSGTIITKLLGTTIDANVGLDGAGEIYCSCTDTNEQQSFYSAVPYPQDGQWHQYVVTFDGTSIKFYQDKKYVKPPKTVTADAALTLSGPVGGGGGVTRVPVTKGLMLGGVNCQMSDLRVYDRALANSEVNKLYQAESKQ